MIYITVMAEHQITDVWPPYNGKYYYVLILSPVPQMYDTELTFLSAVGDKTNKQPEFQKDNNVGILI
jgi:hypothetical protein